MSESKPLSRQFDDAAQLYDLEQTSVAHVAPDQLRPVGDLLVQADSFLDGVLGWSQPSLVCPHV